MSRDKREEFAIWLLTIFVSFPCFLHNILKNENFLGRIKENTISVKLPFDAEDDDVLTTSESR